MYSCIDSQLDLDVRMFGCSGVRMLGCSDVRMFGYSDVSKLCNTDTQVEATLVDLGTRI